MAGTGRQADRQAGRREKISLALPDHTWGLGRMEDGNGWKWGPGEGGMRLGRPCHVCHHLKERRSYVCLLLLACLHTMPMSHAVTSCLFYLLSSYMHAYTGSGDSELVHILLQQLLSFIYLCFYYFLLSHEKPALEEKH